MTEAVHAGAKPNPWHMGWFTPPVIHLLSGGIAGCLAKTVIAPFDRVKILSQTNNKHYPYTGIFSTMNSIYQREGITKLWVGNGATVIRIAPYAAIQFMTYEKAKKVIIRENAEVHAWTPFLHMLCGSVAGTVSTFFTYPLDLLRARLASQVGEGKYRHTFHGMSLMMKHEGTLSLWKGMVPTLQGIIPYAGVNFAVFETLKANCPTNEETGQISPIYKLLSGGLAGAIGQTVSYPWDVVRRRMQTAGFAAGVPEFEYRGSWSTMKSIVRNEGLAALYRGISINFWKVTPAVSISFTVYDSLKGFLTRVSQ